MSSMAVIPAQPEQILKGLSKVWTSLGHEEKQQGAPTVLRACAMTLVVVTDEADCGFEASQTISELMREHPSRGIVLTVSPDVQDQFEARVLAQCWKPFGKAQQICCEQIEIKAAAENWADAGPILDGLTVADLPVVLWCRHLEALKAAARHDKNDGLASLLALSTKIIIDSGMLSRQEALDLLSRWQSENRTVADLEWTRLTAWREPVGHIFDNTDREIKFSDFKHFEVEYSGDQPSLASFYIAGWLSAPGKAPVAFKRVDGYAPGLHSIKLIADNETITFARTGIDCMTLESTNGRSRRYTYADAAAASLMTEELSVTGTDSVFNKALARAKELAGEFK